MNLTLHAGAGAGKNFASPQRPCVSRHGQQQAKAPLDAHPVETRKFGITEFLRCLSNGPAAVGRVPSAKTKIKFSGLSITLTRKPDFL